MRLIGITFAIPFNYIRRTVLAPIGAWLWGDNAGTEKWGDNAGTEKWNDNL